ncbi:hypothetical protein D5F01_LYC20840 [Larimichthys crocea]|uniref:Uncharacterized protein n=3 Tax=Larimichthys crocea TaxID=215358 RepID=A0ACD3QEE9_LARCR|nr:uncharacterized protein LOC104933667 [Larimichthys crocea]KAE8280285.1 hypothetical protein D5F01_LYC20840 [Larimichthys crocea]TMS04913.1 hypothetical protein E3U43_010070 [Larimichthys crocea]
MEHVSEDNHDWPVHRRMDGYVNKHMADIALETLQQRLSAVSDEMHSLADHVSRRSGEEFKDESQRGDMSFCVEPQLSSAGSSEAADRFTSATSTETAAQRKIIALLVEIKEEQQRQWAVLRDLQAQLHGQAAYEEEDVEALDVDLPLRTLEQLDEMERHLEDAGIQRRMVSYLSRMGGATVDDAVRRLMQGVLSFAVGSELNWVGRGQKRSFRNTRLQGVLFRALKRTPVGKEATHHQFADVVKKWLRFAPFRQGGTGRRCCKPPVEFPDSEGTD